jgi:hypothetical protein
MRISSVVSRVERPTVSEFVEGDRGLSGTCDMNGAALGAQLEAARA